jgi:hypothetical protein
MISRKQNLCEQSLIVVQPMNEMRRNDDAMKTDAGIKKAK